MYTNTFVTRINIERRYGVGDGYLYCDPMIIEWQFSVFVCSIIFGVNIIRCNGLILNEIRISIN